MLIPFVSLYHSEYTSLNDRYVSFGAGACAYASVASIPMIGNPDCANIPKKNH